MNPSFSCAAHGAHVPQRRAFLGHDRAPQGVGILYRADRDPFAHQGRRGQPGRAPAPVRPGQPAHHRFGGRTHQPRGLDLVPTRTSAASAARSSTPGGRPKPAGTCSRRCREPRRSNRGSCTLPLPGIVAAIVDETGGDVEQGKGGFLVIKRPWPAAIRNIWGDPERFKKSYFPPNCMAITWPATAPARRRWLFSGSWGASTTCSTCPATGWAPWRWNRRWWRMKWSPRPAVVGRPDDTTGEAVVAFVVLKRNRPEGEEAQAIAKQLRGLGGREIRSIAQGHPLRRQTCPRPVRARSCRLLRVVAKGEEVAGRVHPWRTRPSSSNWPNRWIVRRPPPDAATERCAARRIMLPSVCSQPGRSHDRARFSAAHGFSRGYWK